MIPKLIIGQAIIYSGNNLEVLPELASNSVDSIVCDPPYELGFMGKTWDNSGIAYSVELWQQCLRVLKPGGHLLAFGGTRTWHRLAVAIEDAGFEIRDNIAWLYGSGFPKSHNISKAIDKMAGAEREVLGRNPNSRENATKENTLYESGTVGKTDLITAPATNEAKQWDGWGTALKPAHEPIVVARKPVIGTVAQNVLKYGTGGINIDACRIGYKDEEDKQSAMPGSTPETQIATGNVQILSGIRQPHDLSVGRWPANIILDETTAKLLDEQSGITKSTGGRIGKKDVSNINFGLSGKYEKGDAGFGDVGGASRYFKIIKEKENNGTNNQAIKKGNQTAELFATDNSGAQLSDGVGESFGHSSNFFYVAKASKRDRNEGLDELPDQMLTGRDEGQDDRQVPYKTRSNPVKNTHPTVKPTALMQYLIRLVTPSNGVVLDPFTGSGSTGKAAILEGKRFIGIELTPEYLPIIEGRLKHAYLTLDDKEDDLFE